MTIDFENLRAKLSSYRRVKIFTLYWVFHNYTTDNNFSYIKNKTTLS